MRTQSCAFKLDYKSGLPILQCWKEADRAATHRATTALEMFCAGVKVVLGPLILEKKNL